MAVETRINVYPESKEITLHYYQSEIMRSPLRYLALIAGTGGGKTFLGPIWLLEEIRGNPAGEFMIVAPTYKMLIRKSLPATMEYFDKVGVDYEFKKQDMELKLATGGRVFLGSADNPFTLEGVQCHAIWADEAGQMKRQIWAVMQRRVGVHQGRILITTTPYSMNWLYSDFFKLWEKRNKDYFLVRFPSIANPHYPKEEYERAKSTMDPETFAMFYDAKFMRKSGLVYREFNENMIIEPFDIPADWRLIAGIDWGYNHPFVFSLWAKNKEDVCYNCGEYYQKQKSLADHALAIKNLIGDRHVIAYYDPENPQSAKDLKEEFGRISCFNITLRPAYRSGTEWVMDGIRYIKSLMWQNKYFVFNTCKKNLEEKKIYHWIPRQDGTDYQDKPTKLNEDCQSAERYCLYTDRKTKLQFYVV